MKWVRGVRTNAPDGYRINVVWGSVSFMKDVHPPLRLRRPRAALPSALPQASLTARPEAATREDIAENLAPAVSLGLVAFCLDAAGAARRAVENRFRRGRPEMSAAHGLHFWNLW
jgi:hypothetical protein